MTGSARHALVTGASSGIGEACVRKLREAGYAVTAVARRVGRLEAMMRETGAEALVLDLTDTTRLYEALEGRIFDVVVNNAGLGRGFDGFLTATREDIEQTLRTNVEAALHVMRAVLPGMVRGGHGHVVHLGSVAGLYPTRSAIYGASKGAIHLFAQSLRVELAGTGVRSTEIIPGRVHTEFFEAAIPNDAARAKTQVEITELSANDVASAVVWVLGAPPHVDVTALEILPTDQAIGGVILKASKTGSP